MITNNVTVQATHFDEKPPFIPGRWFMRANGYQYSYILKDLMISKYLRDLDLMTSTKVLDVGCGDCVFLDRIGTSFHSNGFGVDVSAASLRRGKIESINQINTAQADASMLPFPENHFDISTSFDVLEHIQQPENAIDEMVRVVGPGGKVFCYAVSNKNRLTFNWFLTSVMDRMGIDHWSRACHEVDLLVDPEKIYQRFVELGCIVKVCEPFHAFFTIFFDQIILVLYWLCSKVGFYNSRGRVERVFLQIHFRTMELICRIFLVPMKRLDALWTKRGLGNGFIIIAEKGP